MDAIVEECVEKLHEVFERTDLDVEWVKVQQKVEEARYNPGALRPLADCILSFLLVARSRGYGVDAVVKEIEKIAGESIDRRWKRMDDGTYVGV